MYTWTFWVKRNENFSHFDRECQIVFQTVFIKFCYHLVQKYHFSHTFVKLLKFCPIWWMRYIYISFKFRFPCYRWVWVFFHMFITSPMTTQETTFCILTTSCCKPSPGLRLLHVFFLFLSFCVKSQTSHFGFPLLSESKSLPISYNHRNNLISGTKMASSGAYAHSTLLHSTKSWSIPLPPLFRLEHRPPPLPLPHLCEGVDMCTVILTSSLFPLPHSL